MINSHIDKDKKDVGTCEKVKRLLVISTIYLIALGLFFAVNLFLFWVTDKIGSPDWTSRWFWLTYFLHFTIFWVIKVLTWLFIICFAIFWCTAVIFSYKKTCDKDSRL